MLEKLIENPRELINYLENLLKKPDYISNQDIKELIDKFPFNLSAGFKNPNFLTTQIFRQRKDLVEPQLLAEKLNIDEKTAESILQEQELYALFPLSDSINSLIARALIIPLKTQQVITPDPIPDKGPLETLKNLSGSGFYITFDTVFDYKTSSYMLSVYSALKFGKRAEKIAFTGKITPSGSIEMVNNLEKKKECSRSTGIPLVFPHDCMRSIDDIDEFLTRLEFPVAVIPGKDPSSFINQFRFSPHYLSEVFHLTEDPIMEEPLDNTVEGFTHFAEKIDRLSSQLAKASELLPFKVALTTSVLALSFYTGVRFSKYHLPVKYYKLINVKEGYKHYFSIERDFNSNGSFEPDIIREDKEIKTVAVISKSSPPDLPDALIIKVPQGEAPDQKPLQIASSISSLLRKKDVSGSTLCLEIPAGLSFALGYFLEDYKTLHLTHFINGDYKPVLTIGTPKGGQLYLTNAFSLNMLTNDEYYIKAKKLTMQEAKELLLRKGFKSFISHESTAKILTKLLNTEVEFKREPVTLKNGDELVVFQIRVRLKEGQTLKETDLESLIKSENFTFFHLKVYA